MNHLTRKDYAQALDLLAALEPASGDLDAFARAAARLLGGFVAAELVTMSVCDLANDRQTPGLSDALGSRDFHASPLYVECDQGSGPDQVVAVPLHVEGRTLVSIVLNRRRADFSERDWERLELLRPHLAFFYRQACRARPALSAQELTPRECEVLRWLATGKTDADIAALLGISVRTVHKHLEHVYVKLGVETRTAAVMRALGILGVLTQLPT